MKKIKKTENGLKKILFLGEIPPTGWQSDLTATPQQCALIAERFELPTIKNITTHIHADIDKDIIRISGHIKATLERICVVSLEKFDEKLDTDFQALFSENIPLIRDGEMKEDIEPIHHGKLDIFDIIAEQIGLNMAQFPRKGNISGDYIEKDDSGNYPFANLKKLIKKD